MDNRRISKRFKLHQVIEISYTGEEIFNKATVLDISLEGIQCKLSNPAEFGSEIFLMFEVPQGANTRIVKCYGDIAWHKNNDEGFFVGISFKYMKKDDKAALSDYLTTL